MSLSFEEFEEESNYYQCIPINSADKEYRITHATSLLLWYIKVTPKTELFCEIGCGTGFSTFWIAKTYGIRGIGIDKQAALKEHFERNALLCGLEEKVSFTGCSVQEVSQCFASSTMDIVFSNPPHYETARGKPYADSRREIIRSSEQHLYDDFCRGIAYLLKSRAYFFLIVSPHSLISWVHSCSANSLAIKNMCFVFGKPKTQAQLVLIKGLKNGKEGFLNIDPPVFLRQETK
jgi:tRNA1(Val) A37 N6-methylase TrmN6